MNTAFRFLQPLPSVLAAALLAVALPAVAGSVEVGYVKPNDFRDAGRDSFARQRTMDALTQYLGVLAKRLPEGQALKVDFTDIDLAGEIYPSTRHFQDLRVLRGGADWPRLWLRFSLVDGSRTLASGEAQLADLGYSFATLRSSLHGGELSYEKRLLKQWFDKTIVATAPR